MAKQTQEAILRSFLAVSAGLPVTTGTSTNTPSLVEGPISDATSVLADTAEIISGGNQGLIGKIFSGNGLLESVNGTGSITGSEGGTPASSVVNTVLKSGLGLVPLVAGLFHLFGGGSEPEPPPLVKYEAAPPVQFSAARWGDAIGDADYDQFGLPRLSTAAQAHTRGVASTADGVVNSGGIAQTGGPVINVNVQAMDSRSFLDHSQDIARAVREAMLNLNSINDVVNDL